MTKKQIRLQKAISEMGYCSRRKAEDLIARGEVFVNGKVVREQGMVIDPDRDRVRVRGTTLQERRKIYLAMYKPVGVICTRNDPEGRPTIYNIVKEKRHVFSVGRLDVDSEGLLLLTNDGDLSHRLTHPSFGIVKEYEVKVQKGLTDEQIFRISEGVDLDGRKTNPCSIELIRRTETNAWYQFIINEGRNRQIRRMVEAVGGFVMKLRRISFAGIQIDNLREGDVRALSSREVFDLQHKVGLDPLENEKVDWDPLSSAVLAYEDDEAPAPAWNSPRRGVKTDSSDDSAKPKARGRFGGRNAGKGPHTEKASSPSRKRSAAEPARAAFSKRGSKPSGKAPASSHPKRGSKDDEVNENVISKGDFKALLGDVPKRRRGKR